MYMNEPGEDLAVLTSTSFRKSSSTGHCMIGTANEQVRVDLSSRDQVTLQMGDPRESSNGRLRNLSERIKKSNDQYNIGIVAMPACPPPSLSVVLCHTMKLISSYRTEKRLITLPIIIASTHTDLDQESNVGSQTNQER